MMISHADEEATMRGDTMRRLMIVVLAAIGFVALSAAAAHAGGSAGARFGSALRCYFINGVDQSRLVTLEDQFGTQENVVVGRGRLICAPTTRAFVQEGDLDVIPDEFPDPEHQKCYEIKGGGRQPRFDPKADVEVADGFGVESVVVRVAQYLCVPASKRRVDGSPD